MTVCESISFREKINIMREAGYFDRSPELFKEKFKWRSDDYLKAIVFIEAIQFLSKHNNGYDIVFRPHPSENIDCWKVLLEGIPNVHVVREGAINAWVQKAFATLHHACTTAIECSVSQKPLVTYVAKELKDHLYQNTLSNQLGHIVDSKESLLKKSTFYLTKLKKIFKKNTQQLPILISKKVFIDDSELAAEKIIKTWENILSKEIFKSINLFKLKFFVLKMNINRLIGDILKKIFAQDLEASEPQIMKNLSLLILMKLIEVLKNYKKY